jgi:HEAT repeat protein
MLTQERLSAASLAELATLANEPALLFIDRAACARELVNRRDPAALPHLLAARGHPDWMVRMQVPRGLVHLGAPADKAMPVLREMLGDAHECVQDAVAWALERFGQGNRAELLAELVSRGRRKPPGGS